MEILPMHVIYLRNSLSAAGFESFIHETGHKSKPLSEANKAFNTGKSRIRALVEHVFGQIVMTMKGKHTRLNSLMRVQGWWGLRKLTVTMRRRAMKLA
jgi:IS5 family transposase